MERVRRRGDEERARALSAGMSHPLNPKRPWDWHDVDGNSFVSNRRGRKLCDAFNAGACVLNLQDATCPKDGTLVHQCSRCLETSHGAHVCPRTDFPASRPVVEGHKGKSKGFGKGKGKLKGYWKS